MTDRQPLMNGADRHLRDLEERLVVMAAQFQRVEGDLDPRRIQRALEELQAVRLELYKLIDRLMDVRTLAMPANWRLRMQYDPVMYVEFLKLADEKMLVLALQEGDESVVEKVQAAIGRVKGER